MGQALGVSVERAPGHEHVGPGRGGPSDGVGPDAPVDLDVDVEAAVEDQLPELGDLGFHGADVGLATEAGVHRHHQHHVHQVEDVLDGRHRRRRVEGDGRRCAGLADLAEAAVQVDRGLGVDDEQFAAGLGVLDEHHLGRVHHQVRLEGDRHGRAAGGDHVGPEREVRDELAVHHVPLDPVDAGVFERLALLAELGEVRRQDRGCDVDGPW